MDSRQISPPRGGTARDAALRRASNLTKWVCVGAVALVGALAGFVAQAKPGHSTNSSGSGGSGAGSGSGASRPTQANVNNRRRRHREHPLLPLPLSAGGDAGSGSGTSARSDAGPQRLRRLLRMITSSRWSALGTTASVFVTEPGAIVGARHLLEADLDRIDRPAAGSATTPSSCGSTRRRATRSRSAIS